MRKGFRPNGKLPESRGQCHDHYFWHFSPKYKKGGNFLKKTML
jgi:hypothetical protein